MKRKYRIVYNTTSSPWIYLVEVKRFWFWYLVTGCMSIEEGKEIIKTKPNRFMFKDYSKVIYTETV